jgi:4-amino-4-deoxy-L-arabinose transferase-like glycosyltransferase
LIANPLPLTTVAKRTESRSRAAYWALAALFLAVYVGSMFSPGLLDDADATHAEAAREMVVTGDYVTLHVNGVRYLEKAPLPYWLVAFSYKIFGVSEFSTRVPMVLSVMLLGLLGVCWGRRAFGERTGIYAGLFIYTCAGVYSRVFLFQKCF